MANKHGSANIEKDFDKWNIKKKQIHQSVFADYVHTREVWWCSVGVNVGYEQDGKHEFYERPTLILKKFSRDMVLAVPLTSKIKSNKYFISFTHGNRQFSAIISQVRLMSSKRLRRKMYVMDSGIFAAIREAVKQMI